ncbi:MAG TPA: dihydrodipicolinate reductase C-terminal domain-containing protein [Solirubrobacteraceae bacterium]|nr:dihydrodipicolinate reductase C-terminal domain-containing protein [Solirubrobacteraceae bacterium]
MIKVAVAGAAGKMGATTCGAVEGAPDMELVAKADPVLGAGLEEALAGADVVVDFTRPDTALANVLACVEAGVHVVVGTTGFEVESLLAELGSDARAEGDGPDGGRPAANVLIVPNFAIGAVLMMRFAAIAAARMAKAEIIELHHDQKLDAPSGTAKLTAELMAEATGSQAPPIHSVRLPGLVANQEVILGDVGQTLTIRHDTTGREAFMPGVLLAVRRVGDLETSPVIGLESLLF